MEHCSTGLPVCKQHAASPEVLLMDPPEMIDPQSTLASDKPGGSLFLTLLTAS